MTRVPSHQNLPKTEDKMCQLNISLKHHSAVPEVTSFRSQGHSSFRRLNCLETTPSKSIAIPKSIFPVLGETEATTDLLDHRLHSWRSLRHQFFSRFKCATSIPTQSITENSRNHSYNQEHNLGRYEEKLNVQIMRLWKSVWLAPPITILEVFIHWELDIERGSKPSTEKRRQIIPYCIRNWKEF